MPAPDPFGIWIEEHGNRRFTVNAERPFWSKPNGSRIARAKAIMRNLIRNGWTCRHCGDPIPEFRRADAHFCCEGCRKRAARARKATVGASCRFGW